MILWTIQPPEIVNMIENTGQFTCDTSLSENYQDFHNAYLWIADEMDKRKIHHPKDVQLPLWAWHTFNWKHKKPDFRGTGLGTPKHQYACIEFEIPDDQVLLSDHNHWHFVLNNSWFDDSTNEEEFDKLHNWFDSLKPTERETLKQDSWQKIFDVTPVHTNWLQTGRYVQATFWTLKKDMIRDIKYFTAK